MPGDENGTANDEEDEPRSNFGGGVSVTGHHVRIEVRNRGEVAGLREVSRDTDEGTFGLTPLAEQCRRVGQLLRGRAAGGGSVVPDRLESVTEEIRSARIRRVKFLHPETPTGGVMQELPGADETPQVLGRDWVLCDLSVVGLANQQMASVV